ncbi:menaquinone biosynthesis protein [Candidatus Sumerlaeota bacterium]|nr:menaquinone biosynthesis protein [Candidatus Sumerlaeota bacterium]
MSARETIRLGVVPYLNVQPLIAHLSTPIDGVEICPAVPSRLVGLLAERAVDVAIAPVFSLLDHPDWAMVPGVGIACDGPVESVVMVSASPRDDIRRVVLDPASMTSSALVQVLWRGHWRRDVEFIRRSQVHLNRELGTAYLLIGDRALRLRREFDHVVDLGEAWKEWTGLPFVFAVWVVREGVDIGPLAERLMEAPEHHSQDLFVEIARAHCGEIGISPEEGLTYLQSSLRFRLGDLEMEGIRRYLHECQGLGFGPREPVALSILRRGDSEETV